MVPIEEVVIPLPTPDITPPITKIYLWRFINNRVSIPHDKNFSPTGVQGSLTIYLPDLEPEQNNKASIITKVAIGAVTLSLIAGVAIYLSQEKKKEEGSAEETVVTEESTPTPTQPVTSSQPTVAAEIALAYDYRDGTYKATGTYTSPAGKEDVSISLTLTGDVITAATFSGQAENPGSKNWQSEFSKGFTQAVVGKDIDSLSLGVVNGSSLTPKGFMDAVASVKTQAKM